MSSTATRVREFLRASGPSTEQDISDALGLSRARVNSALGGLKYKLDIEMVEPANRPAGIAARWGLVARPAPVDTVRTALVKRTALEMAWAA